MIFTNTAHIVTSSIRLCYILDPPGALHPVDSLLLALNLVCVLDILNRLSTGYLENEGKQAVMDRRRIAWLACF